MNQHNYIFYSNQKDYNPADVLQKYLLRKNIDSDSSAEELIRLVAQTKSNEEFLSSPIFS